MLTAAQLIEFLSSCPPETRILVSGYEGGLEDTEPELVTAWRWASDDRDQDWYGPYTTDPDWKLSDGIDATPFLAVWL